jgi:hypothetical protein
MVWLRILRMKRDLNCVPIYYDMSVADVAETRLVGEMLGSAHLGEDPHQMLFEPVLQQRSRAHRIQRGVGLELGGIEVELLLAPYQPCLETLLNDPLEEA